MCHLGFIYKKGEKVEKYNVLCLEIEKNNVALQKAKFCQNFVNALFNSLQSYFWDIFTYFSFTLKP